MSASVSQQITGLFADGKHNLAALVLLVLFGFGLVYAPILLGVVSLLGITLLIGLIRPQILLYFGLFLVIIDILQQIYYLTIYEDFITISSSTLVFVLSLSFWGLGRLTKLYPPLPHSNTLDLPVLVLGLSGWISLLWSPFFFDGINQQVVCLQGLISYFTITRLIQTPRQVEAIFKLWFWAGLFLVAMFIVSLFCNIEPFDSYWRLFDGNMSIRSLSIPQYEGTRETLTGLANRPKHLSAMLSIAIPFTVVRLFVEKRRLAQRVIQIVLLALLTLQLLTHSRVDLAGLLVGWLTFVYLMPALRRNFLRYQLYMMGFVSLAFVLTALFLANFYPSTFIDFQVAYLGMTKSAQSKAGTSTELIGPGSADVRLDRILLAVEKIGETGGLGAGAGGLLRPTGRPDPGTAVLEIFFQHGYGLLSYILVAWVIINMVGEMRQSLRYCQDERYKIFLRGLCWVLAAFAFMSFLDLTLYWIVLGLAMAAAQAVYQEAKGSDYLTITAS
jgi:hypothetical protein